MKINLKPCPFCGSTATLRPIGSEMLRSEMRSYWYAVICSREVCRLGADHTDTDYGYFTEKDAIEAWNRRYRGADSD